MLKDLKEYYIKVEKQYFEMLADIKEYEEAVKGGFIKQERFDEAQVMINTIKNNYDRLTYVMFLLNQPAKKKRVRKQFDKIHKDIKKYVEENKATEKDIITENTDVLKQLRLKLKEIKEEVRKKNDSSVSDAKDNKTK